jgi:hypothetical protein
VPSAHTTAALAAQVRRLVTYLAKATAELSPPEPDMAPQKSAKHVHAANVRWHGTSWPVIRRCVCLAGHRVRAAPGVFVAGDMGRGQSLIVWAIAEGRAAAAGVGPPSDGGDGASCADQAHPRAAALTCPLNCKRLRHAVE